MRTLSLHARRAMTGLLGVVLALPVSMLQAQAPTAAAVHDGRWQPLSLIHI